MQKGSRPKAASFRAVITGYFRFFLPFLGLRTVCW